MVGERRFRILEEDTRPSEQLYRSARVELLDDPEPKTPQEIEAMKDARVALLELLDQLIRRIGSSDDPTKAIEAFARLESTRLVNALTQSISFSPIERQQLLEADSIANRCETMSELLRFRLAATAGSDPSSSTLPN